MCQVEQKKERCFVTKESYMLYIVVKEKEKTRMAGMYGGDRNDDDDGMNNYKGRG